MIKKFDKHDVKPPPKLTNIKKKRMARKRGMQVKQKRNTVAECKVELIEKFGLFLK